MKLRRKKYGPPAPSRCAANSGSLWGYRCELIAGHEGQHRVTTSVATSSRFGREWESGRTTVIW